MGKTSLHDIAYKTLLERIVSCQYKPGSWLNEELLVEELGVSRTPIRSALIRLQQENLVEIMPKRGIQVVPVTPNSIRDLFNLRDLIEPYAIYNYADHFEKDQLLQFLNIFSSQDQSVPPEKTFENDAMFHIAIVSQTRNALLISYYESMQNQLTRIAYMGTAASKRRLADSNKEHSEILLALLKDDREEALEKLRLHLKEGRESAYQTILSAGATV